MASRGQTGASQEAIRRAVQAAYQDWPAYHDWIGLRRNGRIVLQTPYSTGTIAYTHSTRTVTLTGGTFPTWAIDASILIDGIVCDIASRTSATEIVLDATMNPGQDVAAATTYTVYKRWYAMPNDFCNFWGPFDQDTLAFGEYLPPSDYMATHVMGGGRYAPGYYTIMPIPDVYGSVGLFWDNVVSQTTAVDFIYKRKPRTIRYTGHNGADYAGTVTVQAGVATVVGDGTTVESDYIGSVFRISGSATNRPTGIEGLNPFREQRIITAVTDSEHFTLDAAVQTSRTDVRYEISDPLDIDSGSYQAFLALCRRNMAFDKDMKNKAELDADFRGALMRAKCTDRRTSGPRSRLSGSVGYNRLAYSTGSRDIVDDWS